MCLGWGRGKEVPTSLAYPMLARAPEASFFFFLSRVAPVAYASSWARGRLGAAAAGLHLQLAARQILNPLSEAVDQTSQ